MENEQQQQQQEEEEEEEVQISLSVCVFSLLFPFQAARDSFSLFIDF